MPQSGTLYEYNATGSGSTFTIKPGTEKTGTATIENLVAGDQFVFDGKIYTYQGGANSGSTEVGFFAVTKNGVEHFFSFTPQPLPATYTLDTSEGASICFMGGTLITTPSGTAKVEELSVGDLVLTHDGREVPVLWIGRQTVARVFADPLRSLPVRIKAGALDENVPARDLLLSPSHAVLVGGTLVHAGALVNGVSVLREADVPETFVYYHVELEDHSLILAEGVPAETFIDNVDRERFDNWEEHSDLFPHGREISEMDYPRAASARQVPGEILQRLAKRAEKALQAVSQAA